MKVEIGGKEYSFRMGWGALYRFEAAEPQPFDPKKVRHLHLMYYCVLDNANPGLELTFDDFVSALDADPGLAGRLGEAFARELETWSGGSGGSGTADEGQKKS